MMKPAFWNLHAKRELDVTPVYDRALPHRIVACLNVWNDRSVLELTVPSWKSCVDHVIVVDGSYSTTGETSLSTDGTREYLASVFPSLEWLDRVGVSQCEKRTAYLELGRPGDYLFIIDADERVLTGHAFDALPACDVGWIRMQSSLYTKEYGQPRIIRWQPGLHYKGRHHWMYRTDQLLCTHQYGGSGFIHRPIDLVMVNERTLGRSDARRHVKGISLAAQNAIEFTQSATPRTVMSDMTQGKRESLRILNYAYRDDGLAPSRFHTAINRTTPHSSVFFKSRPDPFGVPTQYDAKIHASSLTMAMSLADVIHIHSVMSLTYPVRSAIPLVFHHHGSLLRANAQRYMVEAKRRRALVVVSNLELLSWTDGYPAFFLPNAMPVGRYLALADAHRAVYDGNQPFRIAHSPTFRERKGTAVFLAVCERLNQRGYAVEPVLIENTSHANALQMKASCHAMFDSFWLGMQCSGLEAASMRMPVIAGDSTVAARYQERFGAVPYTFANSDEELEAVLRRLIDDTEFRTAETDRVFDYTVTNHDESAVALTYLDYLDQAFQWRTMARSPYSRIPQARVRSVEAAR